MVITYITLGNKMTFCGREAAQLWGSDSLTQGWL